MKALRTTPVLALLILLLVPLARLEAQVTTYTWTGAAGDWDPQTADNWQDLATPPLYDVTSAHLLFGNTSATYLEYYELYAQQFEISGNKLRYYFYGDYDSLHLGTGGLIYNPALPVTSVLDDHIVLESNQTWNIASGTLIVTSPVTDNLSGYSLTKTGAGTLDLRGTTAGNPSYSWQGGVTLSAGKLIAPAYYGSSSPDISGALGAGTLTFDGGTLVSSGSSYYRNSDNDLLILANNVTSHGLISIDNRVPTIFANYGEGGSHVTLEADTTLSARGYSLEISSNIEESGGSRKLTIDSAAPIILTGDNSYTGGTHVANSILVFGSANAIPANFNDDSSKITATSNGYVGFGDDTRLNDTQIPFLNNFDKANTHGSVGFDTDPALANPNTFTQAIDLSGFASDARLGSATRAILSSTATITPQGADYQFGGGGGWLQVDSALTDGSGARALLVNSPASRPLTLRLTNDSNSYTAGTAVTNSGLIFGVDGLGASSAPAQAQSVTINAGGYVGFERPADTTQQQWIGGGLALIKPASVGMVGFEAQPGNSALIDNSATIDLSSFTNALYLGTATPRHASEGWVPGLVIGANLVTTNGGTDPYRFGAYKGGWLQVQSLLSGSAGVKIGDPYSPGTFGDPLTENYSTVELTGDNQNLTGNVTLYGGQLAVAQSKGESGATPTTALGTGTLVVQGMSLPSDWTDADNVAPYPRLRSSDSNLILPNNITLNSTLEVAGDNSFTLAGTVSGSGGLRVSDGITLTLTQANSFSGGLYVANNSSVHLGDNQAAGTGIIGFGGSTNARVYFDTSAPVIGGLQSKDEYDYAELYATQPNTVLTINQAADTTFFGEFRSNATPDSLRIVKSGAGTLNFDYGGLYYYHGTTEASLPGTPEVGLQVNQGTLIVGPETYIESSNPTIWVHGGTLALNGSAVNNPLVVDNGGKLAGFGYFGPTGGVSIGTGATLAPGFAGKSEIGILSFNHLELNSGGAYEWHVKSTDNSDANGHDYVYVDDGSNQTYTLVLNATSTDRFTLKVISLTLAGNAGALGGFNSSQSYSWDLLGFDVLQGGFDPSKFTLDTTGFANSLNGGFFSLGLIGDEATGGKLVLNFTAVPEPSTYALMALGLAGTVFAAWRKRRRA